MMKCDNCGLDCSNPIANTLGVACSYGCSAALVGKHPEFVACCLRCHKPVGEHPIRHGQRGWCCSPACDFELLCSETFYDDQWKHQYEYTWPAATPPRKHVHSRVVATRPPAAESSGTSIGRQLPR